MAMAMVVGYSRELRLGEGVVLLLEMDSPLVALEFDHCRRDRVVCRNHSLLSISR